MTDLEYWTLEDIYKRIQRTYRVDSGRPLIISVPPNSYGKADTIYIDHHGSPPKGYAIYAKAWRGLYVFDPGFNKKRRVGRSIIVSELDDLEVGFYTWTHEDGLLCYDPQYLSSLYTRDSSDLEVRR